MSEELVFYTTDEVAAILRVTPQTVCEMCRRGDLPARKAGKEWRISRLALEEWARVGSVTQHMANQVADVVIPRVAGAVAEVMRDAFSGR